MPVSKTPRPKSNIDWTDLPLEPHEGFLLSRLDGATTVPELRALTGLPEDRVEAILERLDGLGVLESSTAVPSAPQETVVGGSVVGEPVVGESAAEPEAVDSTPVEETDRNGPSTGLAAARSWRRIFQEELRPLAEDQRVERAADAIDATLRAFCFDPSRRVVEALLDNPRFGLEHARLVADHHETSQGLDALGRRIEWLRDPQVERHLFRNQQTSQRLIARIFARARMAKIYRLAVGHDATTVVRETAKRSFREAFAKGTPEERTKLILDTEGRCLTLLVGFALDGKTSALLRRRSLGSTMLVRNFARWPATPPPLLVHLMRQPHVRRSVALRNALLRHPNAPAEMKRDL